MAEAVVDQVRRFNRTVTERVGALNDHFLGGGRPLGEARLLWEIGVEGCEVRLLRARLGLDSGYLSRLLRKLEADGLVERERRATPTGASASPTSPPKAAPSAQRSTSGPTRSHSRCWRR